MTGMGGYAVNTILGIVCRMVFTRTLNADYLGVTGLFTNILTMLSLAELGIGSAIVYSLYKPLATGDNEKVASLVKFFGKCYRIIGFVVFALGLAISPFLHFIIKTPPHIHENIYLLYYIYLFNTSFTYFFTYRSSLITAAQQNYIVVGLNYIITISQSVIQIFWLFFTRNYLGYLIIQTIGIIVYNLTISYIAKKKFPYIVGENIRPLERKEKKGLAKNVKALIIWKLSGLLVNSTDNIIITYFSGLATVGLSSNYTLLSGTLSSLINQIFSGITASVGNFNAIESPRKKIDLFYTINFANFWIYGWASIAIAILSNDIVAILFGNSYVLNWEISLIISINFFMVGKQNAVWTFKNTMGLFRPGRYLLILTAAINLGCSLWLGTIWGLFGILLATAISRLFTNTWYDPYAVFKYGLKTKVSSYYKKYAFYVIVMAVVGSVCYLLCSIIRLDIVVSIILKLLVCSFVPNLMFIIIFRNRMEYKQLRIRAKQVVVSSISKIKKK